MKVLVISVLFVTLLGVSVQAEVHMAVDSTSSEAIIYFKTADVNDFDALKLNQNLKVEPVVLQNEEIKSIQSTQNDLYISCLRPTQPQGEPLFCRIQVKRGPNAKLSYQAGTVSYELNGSEAQALAQFFNLTLDGFELQSVGGGLRNGSVSLKVTANRFELTAQTTPNPLN
jgi:hypothetical protein